MQQQHAGPSAAAEQPVARRDSPVDDCRSHPDVTGALAEPPAAALLMERGAAAGAAAPLWPAEAEEGPQQQQQQQQQRYIKGTRLIVGGWFQACRGCNEPTAHARAIGGREVPFCPRCGGKFEAMASGAYPPRAAADAAVEPLSYWLPRLLAPMPRVDGAARRRFCDQLVLRQDDAWRALVAASGGGGGGGGAVGAGAAAAVGAGGCSPPRHAAAPAAPCGAAGQAPARAGEGARPAGVGAA